MIFHTEQLKLTQFVCFVYTKGRKVQRFWDGQKAVYVVLLGSTVVLPCINRRNVWTDWSDEEEDQQVCAVPEHVCRFSSDNQSEV